MGQPLTTLVLFSQYTKNFDLLEAAKMRSADMQETVQQLKESNKKLHNLVQLQTDHMNDCKKQVEEKDGEKLELGEQLELAKMAKNEAYSKGETVF